MRNPNREVSKPVQAYRRLRTSFASSALVQRNSANWTAGRGKLMSLRERFAGNGSLQVGSLDPRNPVRSCTTI